MPIDMSLLPTHGQFLEIYKRLRANKKLFAQTPVVFCEGDSWFSTPLYMNLLDWIVFATPEDEARGVPITGRGGLFYRDETSGHMAVDMFTPKSIKRLMKAYHAFEFDIALLSAGGNDFVSDYLKATFAGQGEMSVDDAFDLVVATGRFDQVREAWAAMLTAMVEIRPKTPIVTHTYAYPQRLDTPGELTLLNIGLAATLKKQVGPWIAPHVSKALPSKADQRAFVKRLIDGFAEDVLFELQAMPKFKKQLRVVDLRDECTREVDWFDEMHPTTTSFKRMAPRFGTEIRDVFKLQNA